MLRLLRGQARTPPLLASHIAICEARRRTSPPKTAPRRPWESSMVHGAGRVITTVQDSEYVGSRTNETLIDFRIGQPGPTLLPGAELQAAAAHRFGSVFDPMICQYGATAGYASFREALATFLTDGYGHPVRAADLLVTAGVSHGLDVAVRALTKPGDCVIVEDPTYFLASGILKSSHVRLRGCPTGPDGFDLGAVRAAIAEEEAGGTTVALIYLIPTFNNPTGATMPPGARAELVDLAREIGCRVLADEVYQLLDFGEHPPPPPLRSFDAAGDVVVSASSFSKIFAPGVRLGWLEAGPPLMAELMRNGVLVSGGCISPMSASLVHAALELGLQERHLVKVKCALRERRDAMVGAIAKHLPGLGLLCVPEGGYFVWLELPDGVQGADLNESAREAFGVGFCPGSRCQTTADLSGYARLSFAFYSPPEIEEGVMRLAACIAAATGGGNPG